MTNPTKLAAAAIALAAAAALGLPAVAAVAAAPARTHQSAPTMEIKRSQPNGKTDVIKVM
jgi:hypothetical protein